jgi:hypothetical protein
VEVKRIKPKLPPPKDYTVKSVKKFHPIYDIVEVRPAQGTSAQPSERAITDPLDDAAPVLREPQLTISYQFY